MEHDLRERESIAMHRLVAERVLADPQLVQNAIARVTRLQSCGQLDERIASQWLALLCQDVQRIAEALGEDSERMRAMRQSSPFAGVLSARERWAILRECRRDTRAA